jgi:hypothetical protein
MPGSGTIRSSIQRIERVAVRYAAVTTVISLTLVLLPTLPALLEVLRLGDIYLSADSATHLVRTLHARDYYLPSGHRWGWDPFWFQGYVPFLLYPHLTYVLLALVAHLPIAPHTVLNGYAVGLFVALPLLTGLLLARSRGPVIGSLAAVWVAAASSVYGIGLRGVFEVGLLTQQAGLLVFTLFTHDLIVRGRTTRAAIWMGLGALVHVHTTVIAGIVWAFDGLTRLRDRSVAGDDPAMQVARANQSARAWIAGSCVAALIAAPTVVGVITGWDQVGPSTSFPHPKNLWSLLMRGDLIAPVPILLAVLLAAAAGFVRDPSERPTRRMALVAVGAALVVVSLLNLKFDNLLGRILYYMLRLRSLPFALILFAMLAGRGWPATPRAVKAAVIVLTLAGLPAAWNHMDAMAKRLPRTLPDHRPERAERIRALEPALQWIANDSRGTVSTLAFNLPYGLHRGACLRRIRSITGLPILGGHGLELTSIHNVALVNRPAFMTCGAMNRQLARFSVGYILVSDVDNRMAYESCTHLEPAFRNDHWSVYETGLSWSNSPFPVTGFEHDRTWNRLTWTLEPQATASVLELPIAAAGRFRATLDGQPAAIGRSRDDLLLLTIPAGTASLRLHYTGFPGEWMSLAIGLFGIGLGGVLDRRRTRERDGASVA